MRTPPIVLLLVACLIAVPEVTVGADGSATEPSFEFFESRIRPVLIERCYECHNSVETQEGGLSLGHRAALREGGDSGPAIEPDDPKSSLLLRVIRHELEGREMPLGAPRLPDSVIRDFERWVESGAPDPRHVPPTADEFNEATSWQATLAKRKQWWSLRPIEDKSPPSVDGWSHHPIDRFVLDQMNEKGLAPNGRADDYTLLRRICFAITGLPPTQQLLADFMADSSESRFERVVDQLLRSPGYGERWARHWMDWIRYAESHGSEGDPEIHNAWHYRDYLIRALNADVPYGQLVREHVAGDVLPHPRVNRRLAINESVIGASHWRMVFHGFAPTDALDERVRFTDDQINAFSKAFLGLTVSCARCHDHKFDAVSQSDYYALYGILATCRPSRLVIDLPEKLDHGRRELTELKADLRRAISKDWRSGLTQLADRLREARQEDRAQASGILQSWLELARKVGEGEPAAAVWRQQLEAWRKSRDARVATTADQPVERWDLTGADAQGWYRYGNGLKETPGKAGEFVVALADDKAIARVLPAGVYSHLLSSKHAARLSSPDFTVGGDHDLWVYASGSNAMVRYAVHDYPRSGTVYPVKTLKDTWGWHRFNLNYWIGDTLHVELATGMDAPLLVKEGNRGWFGVREAMVLHREDPAPASPPVASYEALLEFGGEPLKSIEDVLGLYRRCVAEAIECFSRQDMTDAQAILLDECLAAGLLSNRLEELPASRELIARYREVEASVVAATRVPGLEETPAADQPIFQRGDHKRPGTPVPPRFLEAFDSVPYDSRRSGRLQLAEDLVRPDNPLLRRVLVNRVWHHMFGQGLVATPDNFGQLGSQPTHPELLDYLASRFADDGWSLKSLIRSIATSETWKMDSTPSEQSAREDPENLWLSHARVRRLEAEAIRDSLLFVAGQLNFERFGEPVEGHSDRRSVYVRVRRNRLDPFLRVFDFPEPYTAVGRRAATNVPAQSLTMLNDPWVQAQAENWAARWEGEPTDKTRVARMIEGAFSRPATDLEVEQAVQFVKEASWTELARAMFCMKEFIYLR